MMLVIPVSIALAAACGFAGCTALHLKPHVAEMLLAASACLIASEFALVPIILTRGATQPTVAQAGLIGTVIHLFGCSILGGALILFQPLQIDGSVVYWLLGLYWVTLIVLSTGFVRILKAAPIARTEPAH
jgi:hypothetical protein